MTKLEIKVRENPKLEQRVLDDGRVSLYLEYYLGREEEFLLDSEGNRILYDSGKMKGKPRMIVRHKRKKESLGLFLYSTPKNAREKRENRETMETAMRIRAKKEQEVKIAREGLSPSTFDSKDVFEYFETYLKFYKKRDLKQMKFAYKSFRTFLAQDPLYHYLHNLSFNRITKDMILEYVDFLQRTHYGEGARSYYQRFKKVILHAIEHGMMYKNPCKGITIPLDSNRISKDILSEDEIRRFLCLKVKSKHIEIKRAFVFCLYTGMRYCDVKDLTFRNIDRENKMLKFVQSKTMYSSSASSVAVPLNDSILALVGEERESLSERVFDLPSYSTCLRNVKKWFWKAGIKKNISWHCARHSFSVNILVNGANIRTLQSLLGHRTLACTEKYMHVVDKLKNEAIDSLMTFDASQL